MAECLECRAELEAGGAVAPLLNLATFGNDAVKLQALAALDQMGLNNPSTRKRLVDSGALELLHGLRQYGATHMRGAASELVGSLEAATAQVDVDAKGHSALAHQTRVKHSKIWEQVTGQPRAYSRPVQGAAE